MIQSAYINTALGSLLIFLVLFHDYIRKFNTDNFQRKLFLYVLAFASAAIIFEFTGNIFTDTDSKWALTAIRLAVSCFLIAQNCAYYMSIVLVDYISNKNIKRSKIMVKIFSAFIAVYVISVVLNLHYGFYFSINEDNQYIRGNLFILRLAINFLPILIILIDIFLGAKQSKLFQIPAIFLFLTIIIAGAVVDVITEDSSLTWLCFTSALLYLYFFIIQFDSKLDTLTGLGNRRSFNEFIEKLSKLNAKTAYSIAIIDLDRFKQINDTLGHLEGDNALKDMAAIINGNIRHSDFAVRYGGDEFVLVTKAENDIRRLLERIQEAMNTQNGKELKPYKLYMSYGFDVFTTNSGQSIRKFMNHIDSLMYKQKEEHRRLFSRK